MVCPHKVELHAVVVACLEITVVKMAFEKGHSVIPVPVEYKNVHSMVGGGIYLHFGHIGVGFVNVAPQREARLFVSGEFGVVLHHRLPFANAFGPEKFGPVVGMVRRPYECGHIVFLFRCAVVCVAGKNAGGSKKCGGQCEYLFHGVYVFG